MSATATSASTLAPHAPRPVSAASTTEYSVACMTESLQRLLDLLTRAGGGAAAATPLSRPRAALHRRLGVHERLHEAHTASSRRSPSTPSPTTAGGVVRDVPDVQPTKVTLSTPPEREDSAIQDESMHRRHSPRSSSPRLAAAAPAAVPMQQRMTRMVDQMSDLRAENEMLRHQAAGLLAENDTLRHELVALAEAWRSELRTRSPLTHSQRAASRHYARAALGEEEADEDARAGGAREGAYSAREGHSDEQEARSRSRLGPARQWSSSAHELQPRLGGDETASTRRALPFDGLMERGDHGQGQSDGEQQVLPRNGGSASAWASSRQGPSSRREQIANLQAWARARREMHDAANGGFN